MSEWFQARYVALTAFVFCLCAAGAAERRVAVLIPKTGRYAAYGRLQEKGYHLAESRVLRGASVRVRYFDLDEAWGEDLEVLLKNEVLPWKPDVMIGPYSSGRASALVRLVKDENVPLIIPTATLESLTTDESNANVFRLAAPAGMLTETAMDFVAAKKATGEIDRIVVLAEESTFAKGVVDMLKIAAMKYCMEVSEVVFYPPGYLDSKKNALELTEKTALLVVSRSVADCRTITEDFVDRCLLIGLSAGFSTRDYRLYLKRSKYRPIIISPWDNDPSNAVVNAFQQDFSNTYSDAFTKAHPQYHSAQAYSAMMVAKDALDRSSAEGSVHKALASCKVQTPMGTVRFVDFGGYYRQSVLPPVVQTFDGEDFVTLTAANAAATGDRDDASARPSFMKIMLNNQLIALFAILAVGLSLGRITVAGLSLGTGGVLFAALVVGHFHLTIPAGVGSFGLVLFIYCVGVSAGPNFFKSFAQQGLQLAKLSVLTVSVGAGLTAIFIASFDVPLDLAVGLFAGALTSTPALAAGIDALKDFGDLVPVGYGITYPFGVIGVVLFVQLLPRLLRKDLDELDTAKHDGMSQKIRRRVVRIKNPAIIGKTLGEIKFLDQGDCVASRRIEDGKSTPVKYDLVLEEDMQLLLIGSRETLDLTTELIGETVKTNYVLDIEQQQMKVVVTSKNTIRKKMRELQTLKTFGVVISRITRLGVQFVPHGDTVVEEYDILTAVGEKKDLEAFAEFAGHKERALEQTDVFKICIAIILGIMVGKFPIVMPNGKMISLGLAGGPLFVALVLSYFRKVGYFPPASRALMQKLGLMLFLANAGVNAGGRLVPTIQKHGVSLFLMGIALTLLPMIITFIIAHFFMKMNLLDTLGGVCGSMTSTPALGAITTKTDSLQPVTSYAVAYPVALILMTLAVQVLASIFL